MKQINENELIEMIGMDDYMSLLQNMVSHIASSERFEKSTQPIFLNASIFDIDSEKSLFILGSVNKKNSINGMIDFGLNEVWVGAKSDIMDKLLDCYNHFKDLDDNIGFGEREYLG